MITECEKAAASSLDEPVGSGHLFRILLLSMSEIMYSWEVFSSFYGDNDF